MRFEHPEILWLLPAALAALGFFYWRSWRARQRLMTEFIAARLLPSLSAGVSSTRQKLRIALLLTSVACLVLTLARPQFGFDLEETRQRGLDIVVAIDTSKSMLADDIKPSRLARAKLGAMDLLQQAKSDRLGLVAFAGQAFLQCPLTLDDTAFRQCLGALDVNIIPQGGTALAQAIQIAQTAFQKAEGDNHKVLILFTDGDDNDTGALEAARQAAKSGLKIFTVGIGTPDGELLRITDEAGKTDYIRDSQGAVVKSRLNENLLRQIASAANGFYLPLSGAKSIDALYTQGLAPLPKSNVASKRVKRYHEKFHWPLLAALTLLLIEMLLPDRAKVKTFATRSKATVAAMALLAFATPGFASPATALELYRAGKFADAQKQFEQLAQSDKKHDARLPFNSGAAAFRATNYTAAIEHFTAVLSSPDVKLQQAAYYNIGNAQFRLGQTAENVDKVQEFWEAAVKSYQNAVTLDKTDADATYNLEFARRSVTQIKELRDAARRAKEAADDATRRRNYRRAREIMDELLQNNPLGKQFEDFAKKLKEIDAIANP